jgi:hypothetical protein
MWRKDLGELVLYVTIDTFVYCITRLTLIQPFLLLFVVHNAVT